ncbi:MULTISPECIES: head GIN domain-containing protein [unclassified Sphingomonas]|uniref:head GIN domain-containing protein n=1 Tax=unclassified Sphingomonas TaxID=196159 RepID=UPI00044BBD50|nr:MULTISPECIES: head GIN domain-containing protein [unclassified Sphingomonas]EZP50985.1 putative lipoprotein [Sphingomonas sp. RIT328]
MRNISMAMAAMMLVGCSMGYDDGAALAAKGSGPSRTYPAQGFSRIDVTGSDDVDVRLGNGFSVRAEGPADELDTLRIAESDGTLTIGRKRGIGWGRHRAVKVFVTLPRLAEARVTGTATVAVDRITGAGFKAEVSGSGDLNIAALTVDTADLSITGTGDVRAGGAVKMLHVAVAGTGSVDAAGLRVARADVSVAGMGDVRAAVDGPAQVAISGTGDVDLGASARCTVSNHGTGSVRCGG